MRSSFFDKIVLTSKFFAIFVLIAFMQSCSSPPQEFELVRDYEEGEEFSYFIKSEVFNDGVFNSGGEVISNHTIVIKDGTPYEKIEFSDMNMVRSRGVIPMDSIARNTPPVYLSLHPEGEVEYPEMEQMLMMGPIKDLVTLYKSIHPEYGIQNLQNVGDIETYETLVINNWADDELFLINRECLELEHNLKFISDTSIVVETRYMIPRIECLQFPKQYMKTDTVEENYLNNLVMVVEAGKGKKNVIYGTSAYSIVSEFDPETGMLKRSKIRMDIVARVKSGCNKSLEECEGETDTDIRRSVLIELIDE